MEIHNISDDIIEYISDDVKIKFNTKTCILGVSGMSHITARPIILQMIKEKWLPELINVIWFSGDPVYLLTGINAVIYLISTPPSDTPPLRSFTDIIKSN